MGKERLTTSKDSLLTQEYRDLLDAVQESLVLVRKADRTIAYVNPAGARLFALPAGQLVGHECHSFICPAERGPEMIDNKAGIGSGDVVAFEGIRYRKDGTSVDVSFIGFPFRADGDALGSFGIYQNISLRKKAEKQIELSNLALKEQNDMLQRAWDQTIEVMAYAAELRDSYTAGHQKRFSSLSGEIAREMSPPPVSRSSGKRVLPLSGIDM